MEREEFCLNFFYSFHFACLEEKPSVDCSFITDFEDHIFVTVDAEAFFFLHDLISSYVREKERVVSVFFVINSESILLLLYFVTDSGFGGKQSANSKSRTT